MLFLPLLSPWAEHLMLCVDWLATDCCLYVFVLYIILRICPHWRLSVIKIYTRVWSYALRCDAWLDFQVWTTDENIVLVPKRIHAGLCELILIKMVNGGGQDSGRNRPHESFSIAVTAVGCSLFGSCSTSGIFSCSVPVPWSFPIVL